MEDIIKVKFLSQMQIKDVLLNILLELQQACKKNGINFYLVGGSLLSSRETSSFHGMMMSTLE